MPASIRPPDLHPAVTVGPTINGHSSDTKHEAVHFVRTGEAGGRLRATV
jgi:hypothetical protein